MRRPSRDDQPALPTRSARPGRTGLEPSLKRLGDPGCGAAARRPSGPGGFGTRGSGAVSSLMPEVGAYSSVKPVMVTFWMLTLLSARVFKTSMKRWPLAASSAAMITIGSESVSLALST